MSELLQWNGEIIEVKSFEFKLEDMDRKGKFKGLGAFNGNIDEGRDRFHPGQWVKTIKEKANGTFPLLWVHEQRNPVGSFKARDVEEGLMLDPGTLNLSMIENTNIPAVPKAHEAYALYRKNEAGESDMDGLSVGFRPIKGKVDFNTVVHNGEKITVREIRESKLYEVSFAPIQMNILATVTDMKSVDMLQVLIANMKDLDFKIKFFSLLYPSLEPEMVITTLDSLIAKMQEPGTSTPPEIKEPKGNEETFLVKLQKEYLKLGGKNA